jgi:hypothetical protein
MIDKERKEIVPDPYPDYEQSWIIEETQAPQAIPACGLIVEKKGSKVQFYDDEFPGLLYTTESLSYGKESEF